jgi:hypothetical protein
VVKQKSDVDLPIMNKAYRCLFLSHALPTMCAFSGGSWSSEVETVLPDFSGPVLQRPGRLAVSSPLNLLVLWIL